MNKNPIKKYFRKYWYLYVIALTSMFISIFLDMRAPMVTSSIIDDVIVDGKIELLMSLLAYARNRCWKSNISVYKRDNF